MSSRHPSRPDSEESQVDLGEDLLESTRALNPRKGDPAADGARPEVALSPERASDDELQSAQILMGEGLWEQAKEALHRAIRRNPSNRLARKLLEEIQQRELEKLLATSGGTSGGGPIPEDIAAVIRRLDEDWSLGIEDPSSAEGSILVSGEAHQALASSIARQASVMPLRDRADLAIGFIQMEMPEVACMLLEPGTSLAGTFLAIYCWAQLQAGRAFECAATLESRLRDDELRPEVRRELEYILARARERLGERALARELFRLLGEYRDSRARFLALEPRKGRR